MAELKNYYEEQKKTEKRKYKGESIKHLFSEEGLFSWKGRRNRKAYILLSLFLVISNAIFSFIMKLFAQFFHNSTSIFFVLLNLAAYLIFSYIGCVNTIKRGHDINLSGKCTMLYPTIYNLFFVILCSIFYFDRSMSREMASFITIVGIIGFIWAFVLMLFLIFKRGTKGPNKYGPDPLVEVGSVEKVEEEEE